MSHHTQVDLLYAHSSRILRHRVIFVSLAFSFVRNYRVGTAFALTFVSDPRTSLPMPLISTFYRRLSTISHTTTLLPHSFGVHAHSAPVVISVLIRY